MPTSPADSAALWAPPLAAAVPRDLCTDCGISRTPEHKRCGTACQFIKPDYPAMEAQVHGRPRDPAKGDELFFGPYRQMYRAKLGTALAGAQWTGITTRLGEKLLETGAVDAVLTMAPDPDDRWKPVPVLVTRAEGMAQVRGMRMGYAPLLALLQPARDAGYKRIAVIGIPCQVHALRKIEESLGFDRLYVIGTPCSDNTTTERFHDFLALLADDPDSITYLEFRADYHVELRFTDGRVKAIMAGEGEQWLVIRNERGAELLALLGDEVKLAPPGNAGKRASAVKGFIMNVERAAGGLPLRRMPEWVRPIVGWLMPRFGPRGLEFARTRVEMKAAETVVHLRRERPRRMKTMIPAHIWALVAPYDLVPGEGELPASKGDVRQE
ncbi:MAG: coenzyme F420 hydrogenase [Sphingomonas sp. 12-62-6]|nr:MAG: coenzyme F420 hydrogenase [Sphingomonas sp. 12-62-6]